MKTNIIIIYLKAVCESTSLDIPVEENRCTTLLRNLAESMTFFLVLTLVAFYFYTVMDMGIIRLGSHVSFGFLTPTIKFCHFDNI